MTSFTEWLLGQADRDDLVGDVARDAQSDPGWPAGAERLASFDEHLSRYGADLDALHEAWSEWRGSPDG